MEKARRSALGVLVGILSAMLVSSADLGAQDVGPDGVCELGRVTYGRCSRNTQIPRCASYYNSAGTFLKSEKVKKVKK